MSERILRRAIIIITIGLFVSSLFFDAYSFKFNGKESMPSLLALLTGFLSLDISWMANPVLFTAIFIFRKKPNVSFVLAGGASLLALFFLRPHQVMVTEAGHLAKIENWETGYWLWLASCAALFAGSGLVLLVRKKNTQKDL